MVLRRRERAKARIEIIPMIDVVFFLLVFFMMASLAMTMYRGVPVNLPHAATGQAAVAENATVTVSRDGRTYLNREPVEASELGPRIRPLLTANPKLAVIINADTAVAHGRVVDVLDGLRGAGVSRLAIAVVPESR